MPLASTAHVKIGTYEYVVDEGIPDHYHHRFVTLAGRAEQITGSAGKLNPRPGSLLWEIGDWSGGEGAYVFDPNDPTSYDYATGAHGRLRGQLQGMPDRTQVQVTAIGDNNQRPYLALSQGIVYVGCDEKIKQSTDYGASWAAPSGALTITSGDNITAMCGDAAYLYYATDTGAATREIRRLTGTSASEAVLTRGTTAPASPFKGGMAIMNGRLYAWTGRKLYELDVFETVPLTLNQTYRKVYDTGVELVYSAYGGSAQGSWWAGVVTGENAVYYFVGSEGDTMVYRFKDGVGAPFWHLPYGFTGKTLKVQNNVLYCAGHWGGEGTANGFGAIWGLSLKTLQEEFVGWFRKTQGTNLQMQEMANSYGYQILVGGAKSGRVFVYDAEFRAVSLLDDFAVSPAPTNWDSNAKIGDMLTFGPSRVVVFYNPGGTTGTTLETLVYKNDELSNRESTGTLSWTNDSAEWDFDYPNEVKGLDGFHVTFKVEDATTTSGLLANQRITVKYSIDGGSYVTAGSVVTSATTPSGTKGRVWIAAPVDSSSVKFFRLRVQVTIDNNATSGVKPPVVYGVTAEAALLSYTEEWDIVVRVKDERRDTAPNTRQWSADVLRAYLEDLAQNKNVVTFLDGYRERENSGSVSYTVRVLELDDKIDRHEEGYMRVTLRAVAE